MSNTFEEAYNRVRSGGAGVYEQKRGLIDVRGNEAVQFLDGLITNDVETLEDGGQMPAAFPNAQGRLLAVVRVLRQGDRFLFETEEATREKVFQNLFRFTFAGDFFVEDLSDKYRYFEVFQSEPPTVAGGLTFGDRSPWGIFAPLNEAEQFVQRLATSGAVEIADDLYETLRVENGIPLYGIDMDETTIVPEIALDGLISYKKGCYIGQEIIARIHFRGHVAKQLTGLVLETGATAPKLLPGTELTTENGKNAGRVTSVAFSPMRGEIALAFVRYDFLASGTELLAGETRVAVADLPFVS
ncbi:MAG: folate-binding protein YgfZ [Pyrinomonadaceae bacterium]